MHTLALRKSVLCIELGPQWPMAHYDLAYLIKKKRKKHGQPGLEVPSCSSWEGGVHHQWRSRMQRPLTPGNSRVDDGSQSQCEKEGNSKLRLGSGQPFSGGVRGSEEKSVNSVVFRPRTARYWEALTWPERGEGQTRQDREHWGLTHRQGRFH